MPLNSERSCKGFNGAYSAYSFDPRKARVVFLRRITWGTLLSSLGSLRSQTHLLATHFSVCELQIVISITRKEPWHLPAQLAACAGPPQCCTLPGKSTNRSCRPGHCAPRCSLHVPLHPLECAQHACSVPSALLQAAPLRRDQAGMQLDASGVHMQPACMAPRAAHGIDRM